MTDTIIIKKSDLEEWMRLLSISHGWVSNHTYPGYLGSQVSNALDNLALVNNKMDDKLKHPPKPKKRVPSKDK